jgi:hypothetical protein
MPASITSPGVADVVGTRELLKLVAQKLGSQILLFSIAAIVFILIALAALGATGLIGALFVTFIFLVGSAGYLFVEERRRIEDGVPEAVASLTANRLDEIRHGPSTPGALSVQLDVERRNADAHRARDIAVESQSRALFAAGDEVDIRVEASHDCYLTLLNIGTSGKLTILFPNALHPDAFLHGERPHLIPGTEYGFRYVLKGPPGIERLKAIATLEPRPLVEADFSAEGTLFMQVESTAAARDIAIVKSRTDALPDDAWAEAHLEFEVRS